MLSRKLAHQLLVSLLELLDFLVKLADLQLLLSDASEFLLEDIALALGGLHLVNLAFNCLAHAGRAEPVLEFAALFQVLVGILVVLYHFAQVHNWLR